MSSSSDEMYEVAAKYDKKKRMKMPSSTDASPSSSTSTPVSSTVSMGDCTVCLQPAHGLHFNVLSCRACAAFYRRTVFLGKNYTCRRANKNCPISKDERYLCRYCRYQKCIAVGMQSDNVQWNRDKAVSERMKAKGTRTHGQTSESTEAQNAFDANEQKREHPEFFPIVKFFKKPDESDTAPGMSHPSNAANMLLDIGPIIMKVARIFENHPMMPDMLLDIGLRMTLTQRMMVGLNHLRRNQLRNLEVLKHADSARCRVAWEQQLYSIAEWAMHTDEFANLPGDQKLLVYKGSWAAFHRLERFHMTVSIFGRSLLEKGLDKSMIVVFSNDFAVDFYETSFDFSFVTDYDESAVKVMFKPFVVRFFEEIARPMIELQITDTELVFMLGQLTWHLEGRKVSAETLAISESFRARISNELHDYYVYEMKMTNYAARLMKLMGIVNDIENILYERNKVLELARIFDVFKIDMSDGGMISSSRSSS